MTETTFICIAVRGWNGAAAFHVRCGKSSRVAEKSLAGVSDDPLIIHGVSAKGCCPRLSGRTDAYCTKRVKARKIISSHTKYVYHWVIRVWGLLRNVCRGVGAPAK